MEGTAIKAKAKKSEAGYHTKEGNDSIRNWEGRGHCLGSAYQTILPTEEHRSTAETRGWGLGSCSSSFLGGLGQELG